MPCSSARAVGGMRVALAVLALAAWVGVAAGLDTCPAAGGALVSPCAPRTCTVSAVHAGDYHTCALLSHGGVRYNPSTFSLLMA